MRSTLVLISSFLAAVAAVTADGRVGVLTNVTATDALCLDGTTYAYYLDLDPSGERTNWEISIQGGGWCYDEMACAARALTSLGSTKFWPATIPAPGCSATDDTNCNTVHLNYCDGASFSGYREEAWPVHCSAGNNCSWPGENSTNGKGSPPLWFRGIRNLDATLDDVIRLHGLDQAENVVVTGGSAGGLSTFLHVDRVAARLPKAFVTGRPVCGFFLDHGNAGNASAPGERGANFTYTDFMRYVFFMQNASGALSQDCQDSFGPEEAWKCIMAPHAAPFIKTPWFAEQSRFDHWQLAEETFLECIAEQPYHPPYNHSLHNAGCSRAEQVVVQNYGPQFIEQFEPVVRSSNRNGAFLDACIIHGSTTSEIGGVTNEQAFQQWWSATKKQEGSAKRSWFIMECPDGKGGLSNSTGPCDTASVCVPWNQTFFD